LRDLADLKLYVGCTDIGEIEWIVVPASPNTDWLSGGSVHPDVENRLITVETEACHVVSPCAGFVNGKTLFGPYEGTPNIRFDSMKSSHRHKIMKD
jgi:hypothetical protein